MTKRLIKKGWPSYVALTAERDDHKRARTLLAAELKALQDGAAVTTALAAGVEQRIEQLTAERDEARRYEAELEKVCEIVQRHHPIGEVKAIGLMEAVQGMTECFTELTAERDRLRDALQSVADQLTCGCDHSWTIRQRHEPECRSYVGDEAREALSAINESEAKWGWWSD